MLHLEENVISDRFAMKNYIVHFFDNLLIEPSPYRLKIDGLTFDMINLSCASWLERIFEEE